MDNHKTTKRGKRSPRRYFKKMIKGYLTGHVTSDVLLKHEQNIRKHLHNDDEAITVLDKLNDIRSNIGCMV